MSLGEAFIEIRADLRPFGRDLQRNVKPIVESFEKELNRAIGIVAVNSAQTHGRKIGDQLSEGIKNSFSRKFKDKNIFISIAAALGSALDDGISALPTEVKAALVAGIILALPVLGAFLTGAITAAVGGGVAGLGIALASQFEEVQEAATATGRFLRSFLVSNAHAFGQEVIDSLGLIETRAKILEPVIRDIFDFSAPFLEPLTQGLLDGVEELLNSLRDSMGDITPFIQELGVGIAVVLDAIGEAIEILASSAGDGTSALRDLARLIGVLIISGAVLLRVFTMLYGIVRQVVLFIDQYVGAISIPFAALAFFIKENDRAAEHMKAFINTNTDATGSFKGLISATDEETKELRELSRALEAYSDQVKNQLSLNIDWEQSLDDIAAALKENGDTLDIRTQKGRDNAREFLSALEIAEERTLAMLQTGKINNDQAVALYSTQIDTLRNLGTQAGLSKQEFDELFGQIVETAKLRLSAEEMGVNDLTAGLEKAVGRAQKVRGELSRLEKIKIGVASVSGIVPGYADGDVITSPTVAMLGEGGKPEVVIPLTKPARAAELMRQTGLASMVRGGDGAQILVFIGNEQLDSRMVRVAQRTNDANALALAQGPRGI